MTTGVGTEKAEARSFRQPRELAAAFAAGEPRALARAISLVEQSHPGSRELLRLVAERRPAQAPRVGLTGAPGAGKSSLISALIGAARTSGRTVGVLAVDPSSPYSGGALLGDRLRMDDFILDAGVFVRSMGARGRLGGLSPRAAEIAWLMGAFGFDELIVETVGAGQSDHDLTTLVDTTVVVLTPGTGDGVQLEKAGIVEIADVFAVNKADLPGAESLVNAVRSMLRLGPERSWMPPVVPTVSVGSCDVGALWEAIAQHRRALKRRGGPAARTGPSDAETVADIVAARVRRWALVYCSEASRPDEPRAAFAPDNALELAEALCQTLGLPPEPDPTHPVPQPDQEAHR